MAGEPRKRLGELLLEAGVIDAAQLQAALGHQRQWGARLGQALVDLKLVAEADIVQALSRMYGYEVAALDALQPYPLQQALRLVPREFAVRNNLLPMAADPAGITVAMSDPTNLSVVDELRFRTGRRVRICVGGDRAIAAAIRQHYPSEQVLEPIALDLDADDAPGEQVLDPFGGGSKDALEAFFGSGPAPGAPAGARRPSRPPGPPAVRPAPGSAPRPVRPSPTQSNSRTPPTQESRGVTLTQSNSRPAAGPRPGPPVPASSMPGPGAPASVQGQTPASPPVPLGAPPSPHQPHLELEDPQPGSPEAVRLARATLLGDVPADGLSGPEDPAHTHAHAPPAALRPPRAPPEPLFQAVPAPPPSGAAPFTERDRAVLEALDRLAGGAHAEPELLRPAQAMAAIIRLLIRRGIVSEQEFLEELRRG